MTSVYKQAMQLAAQQADVVDRSARKRKTCRRLEQLLEDRSVQPAQ